MCGVVRESGGDCELTDWHGQRWVDLPGHPDDVQAQCRVADVDLAMGKIDEAFDRLLGTIRRTAGEPRDQARVHLLSLFEVFPPRDPRVAKARATLSSLLF